MFDRTELGDALHRTENQFPPLHLRIKVILKRIQLWRECVTIHLHCCVFAAAFITELTLELLRETQRELTNYFNSHRDTHV